MLSTEESLNFSIKKCKIHYFKVNVVHITATSKNAADDKIRQSLRRFSDTHSPPATVVLVSCKYRGDIKCWYFLSAAEMNENPDVLNILISHSCTLLY